MIKDFLVLTVICASIQAQAVVQPTGMTAEPANPVVQWNRNLLSIVRTPGAQPKNLHSTCSFAIMHAAIYDAVNAIDGTHHAYLIHLSGISPGASQEAAAASAAHQVLVALYPNFLATLDSELQQSLAQVSDGPNKELGVAIGQLVADQILALRSNDGSDLEPAAFVFGKFPGDYQSTPPSFSKPQFTEWSHVRPFALLQASQFRPGPPPG